MRKAILLLIVCALVGCSRNETSDTNEKETSSQTVDQVILLDVQGLWGGQDLWIATDGNATCRFVKPPENGKSGLQETRYQFALSEEQLPSLLELIRKHDFLSIRTKDRYGVPDESRPSILVKTEAQTHAVGKWVNDKHKDFDPIYEFLLKIAESGKKGKQVHSGAFGWNWKPDGFPANKSIWDMTSPKVKEK